MKSKRVVILCLLLILVVGVLVYLKNLNITTPRPDVSESSHGHAHEASDHVETTILEERNSEPANLPQKLKTPSGQTSALLQETDEKIIKANRELPTFADIKTLSAEEVHHTPQMILEGGRAIGGILELGENHPEVREKSLHFLKTCAENSDLIPAIRATCWKNLLDQAMKWEVFIELADAKVPQDIQVLASKLP